MAFSSKDTPRLDVFHAAKRSNNLSQFEVDDDDKPRPTPASPGGADLCAPPSVALLRHAPEHGHGAFDNAAQPIAAYRRRLKKLAKLNVRPDFDRPGLQ